MVKIKNNENITDYHQYSGITYKNDELKKSTEIDANTSNKSPLINNELFKNTVSSCIQPTTTQQKELPPATKSVPAEKSDPTPLKQIAIERLKKDERPVQQSTLSEKEIAAIRASNQRAKKFVEETNPTEYPFHISRRDRYRQTSDQVLQYSYTAFKKEDNTVQIFRHVANISFNEMKAEIRGRLTFGGTNAILGEGGFKIAKKLKDIVDIDTIRRVRSVFKQTPNPQMVNNLKLCTEELKTTIDEATGLTGEQLLVLPTVYSYESRNKKCLRYISDTEYMDTDMKKLVQKGKLSHKGLIGAIIQVGEGIAFMHRNGWLHRDLKPENFGVNFNPALPDKTDAKAADFDLAIKKSDLTAHDRLVAGAPLYLAPERIINRVTNPDGKSDVYSFGISLYEMTRGCEEEAYDAMSELFYYYMSVNSNYKTWDELYLKWFEIYETVHADSLYKKYYHEALKRQEVDPVNYTWDRISKTIQRYATCTADALFEKDTNTVIKFILALDKTNPIDQIIFECLNPEVEKRPDMDHVVAKLKNYWNGL